MNLAAETARAIKIPVMLVRQPIGEFYIGSIASQDLVDIADFDIRRIHSEDGIDGFLGIQRELDKKRVKEIRQYVTGTDATFPTSVVLAVPEACVELSQVGDLSSPFFIMTLANKTLAESGDRVLYREIARVIDGQHRIDGLRGYKGAPFEINVSIFIGADIADQAAIFSTVNLAQTKVNRSLVYDLFELSESRSPERTCHNVVVSLDQNSKSPFYKRIKRLGTATEGRFGETLSQATVVNGLLVYVSGDKLQVLKDRQTGRRGGVFQNAEPKDIRKLVLRPMFVKGDDVGIAELIWNYFEAVRERWPEAWAKSGVGNMLNRTNGFDGLIRVFRKAYLYLANPGEMVSTAQFKALFDKSKLTDADFNPQRFVPGSSGATALYNQLVSELEIEDVK